MRMWLGTMTVGIFSLALFAAHAQQPAGKDKEKDKGPMFPPVNPALAKADLIVTGLDGPGFAIAYGKEADLIVASCERNIQAFKKDTLAAFKGGAGKPEIWKGHEGPVRSIAWHGGPTLVSIGADKKVNFWKMPEGKIAQSAAVDFRVRASVMSSDGKAFACAGENDAIQLWDVAAGKATTKLTDKAMDWTLALAFSADGKQLVSGDMLGVVRLWDVAAAKKVADLPAKPTPAPKTPPEPVAITCLAFAPDGKAIVLGSAEGPIQLINLADGKLIRTFTGHTAPITGIVFHPSGTLMASCGKDRTVKLWTPAGPQPALQALKSLDGHTAWVEGIVFIEEGTKLATVSADSTIRTWDLAELPKKK